jgi:hypothetical protein
MLHYLIKQSLKGETISIVMRLTTNMAAVGNDQATMFKGNIFE